MIDRDELLDLIHEEFPDREDVGRLTDRFEALDKAAPIGDPETTQIVNGWLVDTSADEPDPLIDLKILHGWPGREHGAPFELVVPCESEEEANDERVDLHAAAEARSIIRRLR